MSVLLSGFASLYELKGKEWVSFGDNGTFSVISEDRDEEIEPLTITFINPTTDVRFKQRAEKVKASSNGALVMKVTDDANNKLVLGIRFVVEDHLHEVESIYIQRSQIRSAAVEARVAALPGWPCSLCTFLNEGSRDSCSMCLTARTGQEGIAMQSPNANHPLPAPISVQPERMGESYPRRFSGDQTPVIRSPPVERVGGRSSNPFDLYSPSVETMVVESFRMNGGVQAAFADPSASLVQFPALWECHRCHGMNMPDVKACSQCGRPMAHEFDRLSSFKSMPTSRLLYDSSQMDLMGPNEDLVQQNLMARLARQASGGHAGGVSVNLTLSGGESTSKVDFEIAASHIASGREYHLKIFKTLRSVVAKVTQENPIYRELHASNKKVRERLIEQEGVVDFLALLGFESDEDGTKLVCHDIPNEFLVKDALDVLDTYLKNRPQSVMSLISIAPGGILRGESSPSVASGGDSNLAMVAEEKERDANGDGDGDGDDEPLIPDDQNDDEFTLAQIVLWVTQPSERDRENEDVLLLCYFTIATPQFLISALRDRYFSVRIPPNLTREQNTEFIRSYQRPVQLKVANMIKNWIKSYWREDFRNSQEARDAMYIFLDDMAQGTDPFRQQLAESIRNLIRKFVEDDAESAMDDGGIALPRSLSSRLSDVVLPDPEPSTPRSLIPRSFSAKRGFGAPAAGAPPARLAETVANLDDIADQVTLMDFYIFAAIRPRECLGQAWKKEDRQERAPNVLAIIGQFNDFVKWLQIEIISQKSVRDRGRMIKSIIKMGQRLLNLRNYNALYALYSALNASVIVRLDKAWERVPAKQIRVLDELRVIFKHNKNQMNLRTLLRQAAAPSIPHVGIFLQDLVFIDDGNKTRTNVFLREDADAASVFNFDKARRLTERIKTITRYQQRPYDLAEDLVMQKKLYEEMRLVRKINEEVMWEMSSAVKRSDAA